MTSRSPFRFPVRLTAALSLLLSSACAGGNLPTGQGPSGPTYPGFDTWQYPGEGVLSTWRAESPYQWVGVYLESPCHRDTSWMGRRASLDAAGWGIALIYVGQQVFEGQSVDNSGVEQVLCSRTLLTEEQGRTDGRDAINRTRSEGFAAGSVIFLDIERVESIPPEMITYLRGWIETVLDDGSFRPGIYAHRSNAPQLYFEAARLFDARGRADDPVMWIAGGSGFSLDRQASDAGVGFINVWQGALDVQRTWGGRTLTIDENVADRRSPSAP